MSQIVKINHIQGDDIKHIYIFTGDRIIETKTKNYGPGGEEFFSTEEWATIQKKNIPCSVVPHYIHGDDTVGTTKKKIITYLKHKKSTKQLYMFSIKHEKLNPSTLYDQLSQGDNIDVTREILCQYLTNVVPQCSNDKTDCEDIISKEKDIYDYDDILDLDDIRWGEKKFITFPIGQKVFIDKSYPFVANPYNLVLENPLIVGGYDNDIITTQNSNLLFEYGTMCGNNLFICFAEEVFRFAGKTEGITEKYMASLYFPLLFKDNIQSLSQ